MMNICAWISLFYFSQHKEWRKECSLFTHKRNFYNGMWKWKYVDCVMTYYYILVTMHHERNFVYTHNVECTVVHPSARVERKICQIWVRKMHLEIGKCWLRVSATHFHTLCFIILARWNSLTNTNTKLVC